VPFPSQRHRTPLPAHLSRCSAAVGGAAGAAGSVSRAGATRAQDADAGQEVNPEAALGSANSSLMSILARSREFGVMMAVGTRKGEGVRMVIVETLLLSAIGVLIGNLFGIALTLYFNHRGFDLRWLTSQRIVVQGTIIQTVCYPVVHWINSFIVTAAILVLSVIVSIIPVRHISRLDTVKALRAL